MFDKKFFVGKEQLQEAYDRLKSTKKVATEFGVSKKLVLRYMERFGIARKRRVVADFDSDIRGLLEAGETVAAIAGALGFSVGSIRDYMNANGLEVAAKFHKGYIITDSGYKKLRVPDHPKADGKGYVGEHVLVLEKHLGRFLLDEEVAHHKDRDRLNNAIENLELMTHEEHKRHHLQEGDCGGWSDTYFARGKKI